MEGKLPQRRTVLCIVDFVSDNFRRYPQQRLYRLMSCFVESALSVPRRFSSLFFVSAWCLCLDSVFALTHSYSLSVYLFVCFFLEFRSFLRRKKKKTHTHTIWWQRAGHEFFRMPKDVCATERIHVFCEFHEPEMIGIFVCLYTKSFLLFFFDLTWNLPCPERPRLLHPSIVRESFTLVWHTHTTKTCDK